MTTATAPLFAQVLGADVFAGLSPAVRALHSVQGDATWAGQGTITRGRHPLVAPMAWLSRLPPTLREVPVQVRFVTDASGEHWQRRFGTHPMRSRLWQQGGRLREQLGAVRFEFALDTRDGAIHWRLARIWALGVLPLPARWFAGVHCREREHAGRYEFLVDVALPGIGPLIRYEGWLEPQ